MKPARLPIVLAFIVITLTLVLFNLYSIYISGGTKLRIESNQNAAVTVLPTITVATRKAMANTGPSMIQVNVFPTPTIFYPQPEAPKVVAHSPELQRFIDKVADGKQGEIRGVYVSGVFDLPVIQQPEGEWAYVSDELGVVTEFQSAAKNGVIGLLAHNFLSGALFYKLAEGKDVIIVYGNKAVKHYVIQGIYRFQKLIPNSSQSDLIDLSNDKRVTTEEVFNRFYRGKDHVTFQTCLEAQGLSNWGLVFSVAVPVEEAGY